jgi:hypothetical protein
MRSALLLFCILLLAPRLRAQNLVPNWSFEEISECPDDLGQIERATGWLTFRGSCDLYNVCGHPDTTGVPVNWMGEQSPATGQAFAGIVTFSDDDGWPFYVREYFGIHLSTSLQAGVTYTASFKVSATLSQGSQRMMFASDRMGLLFSTTYFFQADLDPVPGYAHVYSDSVVEDTLGWTVISGSFVADSAYQCVVVGNFFTDEETAWTLLDPGGVWNYAYYYVDDVCVSPDPLYCSLLNGLHDTDVEPFRVWYDGQGLLHAAGLLSTRVRRVQVFDAVGRMIATDHVEGRESWSMSITSLTPGIYVVVAEHSNGSRRAERVFLGR